MPFQMAVGGALLLALLVAADGGAPLAPKSANSGCRPALPAFVACLASRQNKPAKIFGTTLGVSRY
jgi:hypothetical protein